MKRFIFLLLFTKVQILLFAQTDNVSLESEVVSDNETYLTCLYQLKVNPLLYLAEYHLSGQVRISKNLAIEAKGGYVYDLPQADYTGFAMHAGVKYRIAGRFQDKKFSYVGLYGLYRDLTYIEYNFDGTADVYDRMIGGFKILFGEEINIKNKTGSGSIGGIVEYFLGFGLRFYDANQLWEYEVFTKSPFSIHLGVRTGIGYFKVR